MAFHVLDATSEEKVSKKSVFFQCVKKMTMIVLKFKKNQHSKPAPVAKLVDALDLGSSNASCVGSSPIRRTKQNPPKV